MFTAACAVALLAPSVVRSQEAPFPSGTTSHQLHGLRCSIVVPAEFDAATENSLVVILHGAGGTETGMAGALRFLADAGYVVLAPKSRGPTWAAKDLENVRAIVGDLQKRLNVGPGRTHGAGYSNGGWNLAGVVYDEKLRFASACWIAAGSRGRKPPKHAKKGMGVLALVGANDPNRDAAENTPKLLRDDVRSAEVRVQPGIGHEWPDAHMEYYRWWLGLQEGRFVPGETLAFDWRQWSPDAPGALDGAKAGGFVYWYSQEQADDDLARALQNDVLQDARVRFFGSQLTAWKAAADDHAETVAALKLKRLPAIVVYDGKGKPKKTLQGKISAKSLASALRSVAPNKKPPKE